MKQGPSCGKKTFREFLQYAAPAVLSMFLTSFIIVVDGLFIGRVIGSTGLAATNLTVPFLYLLFGVSIMVYVGGMVPAAHSLGRGDTAEASRIFSVTFALGIVSVFFIILLGLLFFQRLLGLLHLDGELRRYGSPYLGTLIWFYLFMTMNIGFSIFLRVEGKPRLSLFFSAAGNALNLVLDYLFIVRFGWGMRGAALASGLSMLLPTVCGCLYFLSGRSVFRIIMPSCRLPEVLMILFNGSSEMIGQLSVSVTTYIFNTVILKRLGIDGVAAYTVAGYICMLQGMVLSGIAQGMSPLIGRAFGAADGERVKAFLKVALISSLAVGAVSCFVCLAASPVIPRLYNTDNPGFLAIARRGLGIISCSFLFNGFNIVISAYFTSLRMAGKSAVISTLRGLILINVLVLLLPGILGDMGIWISIPLNEVLVGLLSLILILRSPGVCTSGSAAGNRNDASA